MKKLRKKAEPLHNDLREITESLKETIKGFKEARDLLNGVNKSHGMMSENYFYRSLRKSMTFGGVHYDEIKPKLHSIRKLPDKTRIEGEYDIVLFNDVSVCIIESKYRVRPEDVEKLVNKQVVNFKILFPDYADYKYYLGIAGWGFEGNSEAIARAHGVGVLTLNGDAVEISDADLKVY
nr:hypothetical protein [uncultured bacterium]